MLTQLSQMPAWQYALILLAITTLAGVGLVQWRKARQVEAELALKKELLERGMPLPEIEAILQAGAGTGPSSKAGSHRGTGLNWKTVLALTPAMIVVAALLTAVLIVLIVNLAPSTGPRWPPPPGATKMVEQDPGVLTDDLNRLQGKWEYVQTDGAGIAYRAVNEFKGNKDTLTLYGPGGEVAYAHTVDFRLERTERARLFTFSNLKVVAGPAPGKIPFLEVAKASSCIYKLDGNTWTEVHGCLEGDTVRPPSLLVWKRVKAVKLWGHVFNVPPQAHCSKSSTLIV